MFSPYFSSKWKHSNKTDKDMFKESSGERREDLSNGSTSFSKDCKGERDDNKDSATSEKATYLDNWRGICKERGLEKNKDEREKNGTEKMKRKL